MVTLNNSIWKIILIVYILHRHTCCQFNKKLHMKVTFMNVIHNIVLNALKKKIDKD